MTWLIGFFAKSALMSSPIGGFLKRFWKPLAIIAAAIALLIVHQHYVHKYRDKITTEVNAKWEKKLAAEHAAAVLWKNLFDHSQAEMATAIRTHHEETLRNSAAVADDLRLRGPGAARCGQGDHSSSAAGAGGHVARPGQTGAAVASVPDQGGVDLIGLPFTGTINTGQQCDGNLSEVMSWREWYGKLKDAWPH